MKATPPRRLRITLPTSPHVNSGFSLLEIMVSLVVISLGLLGLAGMSALAINNTSVARTRTLAATFAESLAASISANPAYWGGSATAGIASGYTPPTAEFTVNGSTLGNSALNGKNSDCSSAACAPDAIAAYDLKQWGTALSNQLPNGQGAIVCTLIAATSSYVCRIKVSWTEKNLALHQASGTLDSNTVANTSFEMVIKP